jgi:L-alanine-DL-glutamate epimerase-like enolase superfamily enzyme
MPMSWSRRDFLATSAGAAGGLWWTSRGQAMETSNVTIDRIEAFPLVYPAKGRFKFFEDSQGKSVGRPTVVVKITASDGTVGWGQSVPTPKWSYETLESAYYTITRHLTPVLLGKNPFDLDGINKEMNTWIAPSFSTGQPICKAGIDLALFDLTGKLLGRSAYERWNRRGLDRILMSWTLNPLKLDDIPRLIEEGRAAGYRNFNVKVAPDPKFDVEMCRMVKQLVPDGFLWADANGGYDPDTAYEVLPKLKDAGVAVLEQPLPINRFTGYRRLKQLGALPILMDEGVVSSVELEEFIKLDLLDGVAMKPARCGGITEAVRQIEMVQKAGLMFLGSGLTDPDISLAASLVLYGGYELKYPAALNGPQFLSTLSILKKPLVAVDGYLAVPTGPGLGVEVDEAALQEHRLKTM